MKEHKWEVVMVEAKFLFYTITANKGKSTTLNTLFNQICRKFSKFLVFRDMETA